MYVWATSVAVVAKGKAYMLGQFHTYRAMVFGKSMNRWNDLRHYKN